MIPVHRKFFGVINVRIAGVSQPHAEHGMREKIPHRPPQKEHARLIAFDKAAVKPERIKPGQKARAQKPGRAQKPDQHAVSHTVRPVAPEKINKAKDQEHRAHQKAPA